MLDRALINHPGIQDGKIDIGRILDAMLYYGRVSLIVDSRTFTGLWARLGRDDTAALLTHPAVQAELTPEMPGIYNDVRGGFITHTPVFMSAAGRDDRIIKPTDTVGILHQLLNNQQSTSRADVQWVVKKIRTTRYEKLLGVEARDHRLFESLIRDPATMKLFLSAWVRKHGGVIRENALDYIEVGVERIGSQYIIISNVSLDEVTEGVKFSSEWGEILAEVQGYSHNLFLAEARSADVVTPDVVADIASKRIDLSLMRAANSERTLSAFEQVVFGEGRPFGAAFEAGAIDLRTALRVIDQSRRFRDWLDELPPDADLLREYLQAVSTEPALAGLRGSTVRFALFSGGGLLAEAVTGAGVGVATGLGLSFFDSFFVDKLLRGWRPNVFVENVSKAVKGRH